ncbi:MAG: hypothetical protein M9931_06715 [Chitinophagales bacterium]|nr:hypothetical protein [Chitinophagales bacterium]OJV29844.1 MAG: hypothetical protein BGO32_11895 [Bacteroidetes bacterium 37-13]HRP38992.1 hypothetical protein [Chitinophagales bacterium]
MRFIILLLFSVILQSAVAQVGINILIPDSSAVLQLESNKKGLGLTRLTTTQRDSIYKPLRGLTIFNTQDSVIEYWNGDCWLRVYEKNCYECRINVFNPNPVDTLDRVVADSVFTNITVNQLNGNQQTTLAFIATPPQGVSVYFDGNNILDSSGTVKLVVKADIFAQGGTFTIIVQAICDNEIKFTTYTVYIEPCVQIDVYTDQSSYDLQARNSALLPPGALKCVVFKVNQGAVLHGDSATVPSYSTGNLNPNSIVGIVNNGGFLGRGGNGGFGGNFNQFPPGNPGQNGGNAMNLTTRTILVNNGLIYGGGGGGGSVGVSFSFSVPIIGNVTMGVGLGGGGGSESGLGGSTANNGGLNIGLFQSGLDATAGNASVPGTGGVIAVPISIPISIATINIIPSGGGGNGGGFGQAGQAGFVDLTLQVCISIPIIGNTCFNVPLGGLVPVYGPAGGAPGLAIKRNNNSLQGLPDGSYNSPTVKGVVAP